MCSVVAVGQSISTNRAPTPNCIIDFVSEAATQVLGLSAFVEGTGTFEASDLRPGGALNHRCSGTFSFTGLDVVCVSTTSTDTSTLRFTRSQSGPAAQVPTPIRGRLGSRLRGRRPPWLSDR